MITCVTHTNNATCITILHQQGDGMGTGMGTEKKKRKKTFGDKTKKKLQNTHLMNNEQTCYAASCHIPFI